MSIDAKFLDGQQYTTDSIRVYESVYGTDFISPGGRETALQLAKQLDLRPGQRVLDVGCGLGGAAFLMAEHLGLRVDGIDLSNNMVNAAVTRLNELNLTDQVTLWQGDCVSLEGADVYDAIYSRDVFLHIHDKATLFETLRRLLRLGGRLLFTDYCCRERPWSEDFESYVSQRRYRLHTIDEYAAILRNAGFIGVSAQDQTEQFTMILRGDLERIATSKLDAAQREHLTQDWNGKIERSVRGEQRWGLFTGRK